MAAFQANVFKKRTVRYENGETRYKSIFMVNDQ